MLHLGNMHNLGILGLHCLRFASKILEPVSQRLIFHQVEPDKPQIATGPTHEDEYLRMAVALRDLLPTTNENSDIVKEYHWQVETLAKENTWDKR